MEFNEETRLNGTSPVTQNPETGTTLSSARVAPLQPTADSPGQQYWSRRQTSDSLGGPCSRRLPLLLGRTLRRQTMAQAAAMRVRRTELHSTTDTTGMEPEDFLAGLALLCAAQTIGQCSSHARGQLTELELEEVARGLRAGLALLCGARQQHVTRAALARATHRTGRRARGGRGRARLLFRLLFRRLLVGISPGIALGLVVVSLGHFLRPALRLALWLLRLAGMPLRLTLRRALGLGLGLLLPGLLDPALLRCNARFDLPLLRAIVSDQLFVFLTGVLGSRLRPVVVRREVWQQQSVTRVRQRERESQRRRARERAQSSSLRLYLL